MVVDILVSPSKEYCLEKEVYNYYVKLDKECRNKVLRFCIIYCIIFTGSFIVVNKFFPSILLNVFMISVMVLFLIVSRNIIFTKVISFEDFMFYAKEGILSVKHVKQVTGSKAVYYLDDNEILFLKSHLKIKEIQPMLNSTVRIYYDYKNCPIVIQSIKVNKNN